MSFRLWRQWRNPRDVLTHLRWSRADARRLAFYSSIIKPSDLVFDVGANLGHHSKAFLALGARVVACEPMSYCARFLADAFAGNPRFALVNAGLSHRAGTAVLHLGASHQLSTCDSAWLDRMNEGGRFARHWDHCEPIALTTLDACIDRFGWPAFIKIDVEGHEWAVLQGLSHPVELLSIEFATESLDNIRACVNHLAELAAYQYRLSFADHMMLEPAEWCDGMVLMDRLAAAARRDPLAWGDVYARRRPPYPAVTASM